MALQLTEGKTTFKFISQWFGLKSCSINKSRKSKEKYLHKLNYYCDYHFEKNRIVIDKVFIPEYKKSLDIIDEVFDQAWVDSAENAEFAKMKINTCSNTARYIRKTNEQIKNNLKENTAVNYVNKVKVEKYGKNKMLGFGTQGKCEPVWTHPDGRLLNDEEIAIMRECSKLAYGTPNEQISILYKDFIDNKINKQEMNELIVDLIIDDNKYMNWRNMVESKLGFIPINKTRLYKFL